MATRLSLLGACIWSLAVIFFIIKVIISSCIIATASCIISSAPNLQRLFSSTLYLVVEPSCLRQDIQPLVFIEGLILLLRFMIFKLMIKRKILLHCLILILIQGREQVLIFICKKAMRLILINSFELFGLHSVRLIHQLKILLRLWNFFSKMTSQFWWWLVIHYFKV